MHPETRRGSEPDAEWSLLLRPGLGLKRWLAVAVAGVFMVGFGAALFVSLLLSHGMVAPAVYWLTLQFLPAWAAARS